MGYSPPPHYINHDNPRASALGTKTDVVGLNDPWETKRAAGWLSEREEIRKTRGRRARDLAQTHEDEGTLVEATGEDAVALEDALKEVENIDSSSEDCEEARSTAMPSATEEVE
ncbi:hypothetical protein Sjap_011104 [Stephania japonica]|uniref:Uncharacterized protein n=1 Tax=Stephania japonica TaxID=461633 RepID=A0AAP0JAF8_9MAGN